MAIKTQFAFAVRASALLMLALFVLTGRALGQGTPFNDVIWNATGSPAAHALVRVCTAASVGNPCPGLASIYLNAAETQLASNPVVTDTNGNYSFFATPTIYQLQASVDNGVTWGYTWLIAVSPDGATLVDKTSTQTITGAKAVCNANGVRSASSACFATVQDAINAGAAAVTIPPGTYAAPTSIPQNTSLRCSAWMGCTLTSAANLTYGGAGSTLFEHLNLWGLVFDFGNTSAGLTLTNVQRSEFSIKVQNTTGDALTLLASAGPYAVWPADSVAFNKFDYLEFRNVGEGLVLNGDANLSCGGVQSATAGAVFLNDFRFINDFVSASGTNGIKFTSGTDNNTFGHVFISLANPAANGVLMGSRCATNNGGVINQHFDYLGIDAATSPTGFGIVANQSQATILNYFTGSNLDSTSGLSNNGYAALKIGWTNTVPLSMTAPADQMQSWFMAPSLPATAGGNQNSPIYKICDNEWSGAVSLPGCFVFQVVTNASGVPTFDTLAIIPTSTSTNNNSVSVPQLTLQSPSTNNNITLTVLGTGNGQKINVPVAGGTMALLEGDQTFTGKGTFNGGIETSGITVTGAPIFKTGTASNTDVTGELSFSGGTAASYSWANSYTSHPECAVTPEFDPSTNRYWVTYTSTTSFTINFSGAVTGAVGYVCTGRN